MLNPVNYIAESADSDDEEACSDDFLLVDVRLPATTEAGVQLQHEL